MCHTLILCEHTIDLMKLSDRNDYWKLGRLERHISQMGITKSFPLDDSFL
ncbi:unnamed protein product [Albugo candida]|uniref:Uncharacterized protein n=1 Tax=Albugo candida TaxID=65357 RepID=A0A024FTG6_9STRA|nr:unnamed protein product [Albugo candida]|eukprot:CCI10316.1 unnamed protein product [Albugo candida]